jgi:hypothetical protein
VPEIVNSNPAPVVVIGFDLPFWDLVRFLVKLAFASIPAGIIIAFLYGLILWLAVLMMSLLGHSIHPLHTL